MNFIGETGDQTTNALSAIAILSSAFGDTMSHWLDLKEIKPGCTYWYIRVRQGGKQRSIYCGKRMPTVDEIRSRLEKLQSKSSPDQTGASTRGR